MQFNVHQNMNEQQLYTAADVIAETWYWFRIPDFQLCFKNGIAGKYGRVQYSIDITTFQAWLNAYSIERANEAERAAIKAHKEAKTSAPVQSEEAAKIMRELAAKFDVQKEKPKEVTREMTDEQKLMNRIMRQFDRRPRVNQHFVEYKNQLLAFTEFAKIRLASVKRMSEGRSTLPTQ